MNRPPVASVWQSSVRRFDSGTARSQQELLAVEEPLEIRLCGDLVATTMRTPGHDHELALGFVLAEGIVPDASDVGAVVPCGTPGKSAVDVRSAPGVALDWDASQPTRLVGSSCGVCGRSQIDDLLERVQPVDSSARYAPSWVAELTHRLQAEQVLFRETGGVHAAGFFPQEGAAGVVREDVGRHNAVDKVVGRLALDGRLPAPAGALVVSGRVSFEIVQKALVAGMDLLVSVSAPTSLAVELAARARLTLLSFARAQRFTCYAGVERIDSSQGSARPR